MILAGGDPVKYRAIEIMSVDNYLSLLLYFQESNKKKKYKDED